MIGRTLMGHFKSVQLSIILLQVDTKTDTKVYAGIVRDSGGIRLDSSTECVILSPKNRLLRPTLTAGSTSYRPGDPEFEQRLASPERW